jgi:bacillithiol biosynthesis deacetylase BshB1
MSPTASYGLDVLAFGAHPDDVEIFSGGVLITLADLGYRTGIVDLTRGELASRGTPEGRALEAEEASTVLGLALRENLGLPDGFLDASPDSPHLPLAVAALRRHRPELVLIPWVEDRHPDHVAAGELLTRALFFSGLSKFASGSAPAPFTPRQALYYEMRHRMAASFIVDTSKAWDGSSARSRVISQVTRGASRADVDRVAARDEAIEARDRYRGSQIGQPRRSAAQPQATGLVGPMNHFEPIRSPSRTP